MTQPLGPVLFLAGTAWDVEYDGSVEPTAATDTWTLSGVDHASSDGDELTIENAGTDINAYYRELAGSPSEVWVFAKFRVAQAMTTTYAAQARVELNGKYIRAAIYSCGPTDEQISGGQLAVLRDDASYEMLFRGWPWTSGTSTRTTTSTDRVTFGKLVADDEDEAQHWDFLAYSTASGFLTPYCPDDWLDSEIDTKKKENVAFGGAVETIHERDDRYVSFKIQAISYDQLARFRAWYTGNASAGQTFRIFPDTGNIDTVAPLSVIWAGSGFKARRLPGDQYSMAIRLRVVS